MTRFAVLLASIAMLVLVPAAVAAAGEVHITQGPEGLTNEAAPVFAFEGSDVAYDCRLDSGPWLDCSAEFRAPRLADGGHIFVVRTKDRGANDIRSFRVDTVAPSLSFDTSEAQIADTTATVTFAAEDGADVTCSIDSEPAEQCTTPWTTPDLRNGQHSVNVQAVDAAGNAEVASKLLLFDAAPPETTLEGPDGAIKARTPRYALASSRARSTFECKVDDEGTWGACEAAWTTPELAPGKHRLYARATDAAGNVDPTPALREIEVRDCVDKLTIGVLEAVGDCFAKNADGYYQAEGSVKVNGITFNAIAGRPLVFDPSKRKLSLGRIQLRIAGIVLYQGQLEYTVPDGDEVTLARFDLETHSRTDAAPDDSEGALDLQGDDAANVQGFDLKGEATLKLLKGGKALLAGTIELPKVFADAEGNSLTGAVQIASDNERGVHLAGLQVKAPLAFLGKVEVHNLFLNFNGERNGDAKATCNAESPGLRWDGGADKIVLPTPDKLTVESVGFGFADGAFSYARGGLNWAAPGKAIGAGIRVQKIGISVCAGDPVKVEGRIALTALPNDAGDARLTIPDAGLLFTGGDPWTLRAEAPTAVLKLDRDYTFKDVYVQYASSGAIDFGARLAFALGLKGSLPIGSLDASVAIDAGVAGWIQGGKFNADIDAEGCFAGKFTVADALPVNFKNICPTVTGVVSSKGIALCGNLVVEGKNLGGLGAGYEWGGELKFMAGTCDVNRWRTERPAASAASPGAKVLPLPGGQKGLLVAVRGIGGAPEIELRGPGGTVIRSARDSNEAVRTKAGLAFANRGQQTTYVVLAHPRGGRWTVKALGANQIAEVKTAGLRPAPSVRATVSGKGRDLRVRYRVARVRGQQVTFQEVGRGVSHTLGAVRTGGRGTLRLRPADGPGGRRRVVALVEQDGLPRKRMTVATFKAPPRTRPGAPGAVTVSTGSAGARASAARRSPLTITWRPAKRAARYGVRVALPDGRRLFFLRDADERVVRIPDAGPAGTVKVRVVGLRADNGAGPAATANSSHSRRD